jgi:phosphoglycolate phosphatase-like HAD superfamily hydrolase
MKLKMICFDMDGTIADLYGVQGWCDMLDAKDPTPYITAKPMWDMAELNKVLRTLQREGVEIRVITWLSKRTTPAYSKKVRNAKREWLKAYDFPYDAFHGVKFGTTKADSVRKYLAEDEMAILIDDNIGVRAGWHLGETINPQEEDIIAILKDLLNR